MVRSEKYNNLPLTITVAIILLWLTVSQIVFAFKHPWMTETERVIYLPQALTFKTVAYRDARPQK